MQSSSVDGTSESPETDMTSLSVPDAAEDALLSDTDAETGASVAKALNFEGLDPDGKHALLVDMFPTLRDMTIKSALSSSGGSFSRTVEELLNQVFFEQEAEDPGSTTTVAKGIDGFADDGERRGRKVKGKRKGRRFDASDERGEGSQASAKAGTETMDSKWDAMRKDVEFITSRTKLSMQTVASAYHENGASISLALWALLESDGKTVDEMTVDESSLQAQALELGQSFPKLSPRHIEALIRLSYPSPASAYELAQELTTRPKRKPQSGIEIITKLPPIESTLSPPANKPKPPPQTRVSAAEALAQSTRYDHARQTALSQASAAYRKAKSDPLMGGVAGHYSREAREHDARARQYSAAAADALVQAQSTGRELDLHGVTVKDAVRIARESVTAWWAGLGDERFYPGAGGGGDRLPVADHRAYRIVTGVGRHSQDGRGKLGPAVGRMLLREGWKVRIGEGVLTVTGVARR